MGRSRGKLGAAVAAVAVVAAVLTTVGSSVAPSSADGATPTGCPWVAQSINHTASPEVLADEVIRRMTLAEKAAFVVLSTHAPLENANTGVPRLCIPALSMTDGPDGVANGLVGVTQFPSEIAVAASFDPGLAFALGAAQGEEARAKGIAALQGPELNLTRVPQGGRVFETYGEDPYLASVLGVADARGIQSTGEMADAKHFTAYTQETARLRLDQQVSARALAELYDAPFKAAVQQAHVASVMCSYGELNHVNTCSSPALYATLRSWGFTGFVRSDLGAVPNVGAAFRAGLSLVKPGSPSAIVDLVRRGALPVSALDRAVRAVLVPMFRFGAIAHPLTLSLNATVTTPAHAALALSAAVRSVTLLRNRGAVLPLSPRTSSVAVIGAAAGQAPQTTGGGSSKVAAPYVVTPLRALRSALGSATRVTYEPGGPPNLDLDQLSDVDIVKGVPLKLVKPLAPIGEAGKADIAIERDPSVTPAIATATEPGTGPGWDKWSIVVRATHTGTYEVAFQQYGDTWLTLNGKPFISSPGLHAPANMSATAHFVAGRRYEFAARWFQIRHHAPPKFSLLDVTPMINRAVAAARRASVAVVFASTFDSEGVDSPNLSLSGDQNALISAVAAANPRTIVVLNTGGAVVMPWLSRVAAVLEAWYPGQEDGAAIARVLTGAADPSGRLPLTFPATTAAMPATTDTSFPGVKGTVTFGSGLNVGYRWFQSNGVTPLFPFGFGLDYTTFALSRLSLARVGPNVVAHVSVTNTGRRTGTDVVQVYVAYPRGLGEPPEQLRGLARVSLAPSVTARVAVTLPRSAFQSYAQGALRVVPGAYRIDVGQSSASLTLHATTQL